MFSLAVRLVGLGVDLWDSTRGVLKPVLSSVSEEASTCILATQLFGGVRIAIGLSFVLGAAAGAALGACCRRDGVERRRSYRGAVGRRRGLAGPHSLGRLHRGRVPDGDEGSGSGGSSGSRELVVRMDPRRRRVPALLGDAGGPGGVPVRCDGPRPTEHRRGDRAASGRSDVRERLVSDDGGVRRSSRVCSGMLLRHSAGGAPSGKAGSPGKGAWDIGLGIDGSSSGD